MNTLVSMADSGSWSLGVLIGGPLAVILLLCGLAVIGWGIFAARESSGYEGGWAIVGGGAFCVALLVAVFLAYYPWNGEYHQWRDTTGTVEKVDRRLISSGSDSMEDKFVIRYEGSAQQYGCDDTRCAQVVKGDRLALTCKRAWQYTGTDGYDCRFVAVASRG